MNERERECLRLLCKAVDRIATDYYVRGKEEVLANYECADLRAFAEAEQPKAATGSEVLPCGQPRIAKTVCTRSFSDCHAAGICPIHKWQSQPQPVAAYKNCAAINCTAQATAEEIVEAMVLALKDAESGMDSEWFTRKEAAIICAAVALRMKEEGRL